MSSPYDRNPPRARTGYEKDERYEPRPAAETAETGEAADAKAEEAAVAAPAPAEAAPVVVAPAAKPATPDELHMPVDLDRLLGGIGEEPTLPAVAAEAPVSAPAAAAVPVAAGPGPKLATPDELGMPVNLDALLGGIGEAAPPGPVAALAPAAPVPPVAEPAAPAPPPKLATPDDLGMPVNLDALLGGIGEEK